MIKKYLVSPPIDARFQLPIFSRIFERVARGEYIEYEEINELTNIMFEIRNNYPDLDDMIRLRIVATDDVDENNFNFLYDTKVIQVTEQTRRFKYDNNLKQCCLAFQDARHKTASPMHQMFLAFQKVALVENKYDKSFFEFDKQAFEELDISMMCGYKSISTRQRRLNDLRTAMMWFNLNIDEGQYNYDFQNFYFKSVSSNEHELTNNFRHYMTRQQMLEALNYLEEPQIYIIVLLLYKGVKTKAELCNIKLNDIDLDTMQIHINKSDYPRSIPISKDEEYYFMAALQSNSATTPHGKLVILPDTGYLLRPFKTPLNKNGAISVNTLTQRLEVINSVLKETLGLMTGTPMTIIKSGMFDFLKAEIARLKKFYGDELTDSNIERIATFKAMYRYGRCSKQDMKRGINEIEENYVWRTRYNAGYSVAIQRLLNDYRQGYLPLFKDEEE